MKTALLVALVCVFTSSPVSAASLPQEEETREFHVFEREDLHSITLLVSRLTGRRMMWTEDLGLTNKRINFSLASPLKDPAKIFRVYQSFLNMNDLVLVPVRGSEEGEQYYKISLASTAPKRAIPVVDGTEKPEDRFVSRVFRLQYVSPTEVHAALINMATFPQGILRIESAGVVVISDYDYNLQRFERIISEMDRPEGRERIEVISLENRKVEEVHALLEELVATRGKNPDSKGRMTGTSSAPRVIPDEESNSLVIRATAEWLEKIRRVVEILDRKR